MRIDKAYEEAKLALQIKYGFKSKRAMEKANEKMAQGGFALSKSPYIIINYATQTKE